MAEDERAYQRQRRAYKALYRPAKLLMKGLLNYTYELGPRTEGPCLILSNHVTDFDPILVGLSFPEHMYYVAGENVMRMGFLSKVVTRYASVIQRIKGTTDAEAALQILRTLRKGRNVCMFAEGNRTFTGETLPIAPATAKLVKMSRSTLVTYRLTGGYLSTPRWSTHRRKGCMYGAPVGVYPPEEIKKMSEAEISALLARDLYENAYDTQAKAPVAFRGKALAETLETALYLCPKCRRIDTLHSQGDRFFCDCGLSMTLDEFGFFRGDGLAFKTPLDWDKWQTGEMERLAETLETALYLCPRCHKIDTLHSRGDRFSCDCGLTMTLDQFGFFQGEDLPFKTPLDWDRWQTGEMENLAESLGDEAAFSDEGQTLNRKEDDHSLTPLVTGTMALYRDRLTVGDLAFPLRDLRGIGLIQRQGMVFSTADGDFAIPAERLRCVRKYQTLFEFLKGNN